MNPTITMDHANVLARKRECTDKVMWLGLRSATSKYGQYDDTLALLTPDSYTEYKGNTLPSIERDGLAVLQPGDFLYTADLHGIHHLNTANSGDAVIMAWLRANKGKDYPAIPGRLLPYWAFRQHGPVLIKRIGETEIHPDGWPGNPAFIDLHHGGYNLTSSEGCQTFYPDHWEQARATGYAAMDKYSQPVITYSLHLMNI